jgi:hypothetical protein
MALQDSGEHGEAAVIWRQIVDAAPQSAEAWSNLGRTLAALGRFADAEQATRQAVAMKPAAPWAHRNLGQMLLDAGRWSDAIAPLKAWLEIEPANPQARLALAYAYLGSGDIREGGPLYDSRMDIPSQGAERPPLPNEWRGEPLSGKSLLIWPEQGFGDQIQLSRFAPLLQRAGADVTLVCPLQLTTLFESLGVRTVEQARETTFPKPDYWTLPFSIPHRLGLTLGEIPTAPYLSAPEDRRRTWAGRVPPGAIGIVWKGRPTPNPARSMPSGDLLAPLAATGRPLVDLSEPEGDFADTAAIIEQLDALITVDTAFAHLAGALGKPCLVMLPFLRPDCRWLERRDDSPWYPTVRLFRQPAPGDWTSVVSEVGQALNA